MIVDCHVHLNNYHEETKGPTQKNVARLAAAMERADVDHSVILTSYMVNDARPSVDQILEAVSEDPRFTVVAGLGLTRPTVDWSHLEEHLRDGTVKGLKLYPGYEYFYPHDAICGPVYELAAQYKVPVMVHSGDTYSSKGKVKYSHPIHIDDVAVDHPDVTFIICHLGNPWLRDTAELLYKNENVYADVSGLTLVDFEERFEVFLLDEVKRMIRYMGEPHKLLFGTDWPIAEMAPYVSFMEKLLEPEDRERVMWQNAATMFGIETESLEAARKARLAKDVEQRADPVA
ncbi:MAG: amidohydrolase family protein [Euryarchaeota archaeon]|nr:amidohydrolase family protein [Euryarchaeota archaeon]